MNRDKNEDFTIDTDYTIKNYTSIDSSYLVQSRSDIKAVEQDLKVNQLELNLREVNCANFIPNINLSVFYF